MGKYEILEKIGEGGFGVVYKGRDPFIKRIVAIKTCATADVAVRDRFFLEARISGNLHHPNVVTIHDFGVEGDTPFLVQEFLDGEDLDRMIDDEQRQVPIEKKIDHLYEVARGLGYAHGQGVIHRDVKPANIRILESGRVKVMDFGIAKLKGQASGLTETGTTVGTVSYLSPEQLRGQELDQRCDIFSFGIVAYEYVTGHRPFEGRSFSELCRKILSEEAPRLDLAVDACPPGLSDVVARCLEKDPEKRYPSFDKVQNDLMALRSELEAAAAAAASDEPVAFQDTDSVSLGQEGPGFEESSEAGDLTEAPSGRAHPEADTVVPGMPEPSKMSVRADLIRKAKASRYAHELVAEAMRHLDGDDLLVARERLTEANRIDPGNIPAVALLSRVRQILA